MGISMWVIICSLASLILSGCSFIYLLRRTSSKRILTDFREEVNGIIAEIHAATDRDARLIEERIKTLRSILEDVDKRISVHIREFERRRTEERTYAELGKRHAAASPYTPFPQQRSEPAPRDDPPELYTDRTEKPQKPYTGPRIVTREELQPKPVPVIEQVAELAKAGLSANIIAARLGISISEVELAIAIGNR